MLLENKLRLHYEMLPPMSDDVYRVRLGGEDETFIFPNGTFCSWAATPGQIHSLMQILSDVEVRPYTQPESEYVVCSSCTLSFHVI